MKKIFKKSLNTGNYQNKGSLILLMIRLVIGAFMLSHGLGKLSMLLGNAPITFPDPLGIGAVSSLSLTVFAEVFCSLFLILGIVTRLSTIPLIVTMLIAVFVIHFNDGFEKKELPLLYTLIYIVIAVAGAGKFSIDNWLSKKMI